jgi:hypothetical protein
LSLARYAQAPVAHSFSGIGKHICSRNKALFPDGLPDAS